MVKIKGNNNTTQQQIRQTNNRVQAQHTNKVQVQHQHHRHPQSSFASGNVLSEEQRFKLYHTITEYPSVARFIGKLRRNSNSTAKTYRTFLVYFEPFLNKKYGDKTTIETVIPKIKNGKVDVYLLIEDFVSFMLTELVKTASTTKMGVNVIKSLLRSSMITLDTNIVKNTAGVPRIHKEAEYPLDKNTVAKIIQSCKDRRLKALLFFLASSGARIGESTSIRWCDISFDKNPCEIRLPAEITKTKTARTIYISNEAKNELLSWKHYKEIERGQRTASNSPRSLVFQSYLFPGKDKIDEINSEYIKTNMGQAFSKLLASLNLKTPKKEYSSSSNNNNGDNGEDNNNCIIKHTRYKITLHSLRAFFKTQCSLVAKEFELSEYLLGHNSSIAQRYFRASPEAVAETYKEKVMETVTFFDFESIDKKIKTLEAKTEMINEIKMQVISQAEKIEKLESEKDKTFADYMTDDYANQRIIEMLEKKIDDLKRRLDEKDGK